LADRIALVVVPAAGEDEEFGFEIGQPRRPFGQQDLGRLELCGADHYAARLIALWLYGDDSRNPSSKLLNERGPGAGVLDQNTPRVPSFGEGLHACLESGVIDALPADIDEIPKFLACHDPGRAIRPVVARAALAGRVPTLQREQAVGCGREFRIPPV
jgi:hypothetical protein